MALWVAEQCTLIIFTSLLQWFPNPFLFPSYYLTFLFCCCCFSFSFHHLGHFLLPKYSWIHVYALKHGKLTRENWPYISQQLLIAHRSITCRGIISSPALFFIMGFGFFFSALHRFFRQKYNIIDVWRYCFLIVVYYLWCLYYFYLLFGNDFWALEKGNAVYRFLLGLWIWHPLIFCVLVSYGVLS